MGDADEDTTAQRCEHRDDPEALRPEKRHGDTRDASVLVMPRDGGGGESPMPVSTALVGGGGRVRSVMMGLAARLLLLLFQIGGLRRLVGAAERPRLARLWRRSGR